MNVPEGDRRCRSIQVPNRAAKLAPGCRKKAEVVLPSAALPVKVAPVITMPALARAPPKLTFVPLVWLFTNDVLSRVRLAPALL